MRKARQRAIRAAFVRSFGHPPERRRWIAWDRYVTSEWRRAKKAHKRATARSETLSSERAVTAAHRDEMRRFVKRNARKRRKAA